MSKRMRVPSGLAFAILMAAMPIAIINAACAATINFTRVPSYAPSAIGTELRLVAPNVHSDCDPSSACGAGYFNAANVQLWAFMSPYPTPGQMATGVPSGGYLLAMAPLVDFSAMTGYSRASDDFVPYAPPPAGTYYLSLLILGTSGPLSNVVVYDAYNFPGAVALGPQAPEAPASPIVGVVEYYNEAMGHYFMTPLPAEIALCDAGTVPCSGWVPTGKSFNAFASAGEPPWSVPVCRFYNDSFAPKSSHFYALHGGVCEDTLRLFPDWQLEDANLFAMDAPLADGSCLAGYVPVFRMYNNGMGGAPNHRFTTDPAVREQMLSNGWVPEGLGLMGVAFCSPQ